MFKACSCLLTTSFLFPVSNLHFWASAMISWFSWFYRLYLFQTDHAVSYFLIGLFFFLFYSVVVFFYLQFYLFLIFLTLPQLSVVLLHYSQDKNLTSSFCCTTFFYTDQTSSSNVLITIDLGCKVLPAINCFLVQRSSSFVFCLVQESCTICYYRYSPSV